MFFVKTHKKENIIPFFNCTRTNKILFYYSLAISIANFPAFILSFYKRSKREINEIKILLFSDTNETPPIKHKQDNEQHVGLLFSIFSLTLGVFNNMAKKLTG